MSQATVSRIVAKVSRALAGKAVQFIKWPVDLQRAKEKFHSIAGFPGIVGCIDCTHVKIRNPHGNEPMLYCNRKGFYSLNVQVICDADTSIINIVARWRGSVHDSRIWGNCRTRDQFEVNI